MWSFASLSVIMKLDMDRHRKVLAIQIIFSAYLLLTLVIDRIIGVSYSITVYSLIGLIIVNIFDPFFRKALKTELSFPVIFIDLLFAVTGTYTGNRFDLYHRFFMYDIILHFLSGILIVLTLYEVLFPQRMLKVTGLGYRLFIIALAGIAGAAVWEICEFFLDIISGQDVQRNLLDEWEIFGCAWQNSGLKDTMNDIINGTAGALVGCLILFIENKCRKVTDKSNI